VNKRNKTKEEKGEGEEPLSPRPLLGQIFKKDFL